MRWESNKPKYNGQLRKINVFLWFPRKVNHEWRWLESATIQQKVDRIYGAWDSYLVWQDIQWVDDKKEEVKLSK